MDNGTIEKIKLTTGPLSLRRITIDIDPVDGDWAVEATLVDSETQEVARVPATITSIEGFRLLDAVGG